MRTERQRPPPARNGLSAAALIEIAAQTAVLYVTVTAALALQDRLTLLPALGRTVLGPTEESTIRLYFLVCHVGAYLAARAFQRAPLLSSPRRVLIEAYFATGATGFAASALFVLTSLPFAANLYALVYAALGLIYLLVMVAVARASRRGPRRTLSELRPVLVSRATGAALLLAASPGILAASSANRDVESFINLLRVVANVRTSSEWALVRAFPEQVFEQPMYLLADPVEAERLLVLSRTGRLRSFAGGTETLLLDLWPEVGSVEAEMGAFSFALHPDFGRPGSPNRGFVYLWYSHFEEGTLALRLTRFDIGLPTLEERHASRLPLMSIPRPANGIHNGGTVLFGPDGFLYLSIGDFFDYRNAQGGDRTLAGGIVRIDVDRRGGSISTPIRRAPEGAFTGNYHIPTSNPWHGVEGVLEELWAIGLRNPFRMSMDERGRLWVGDVGWHAWEEHDVVTKGDNGGWPFREGPEETVYERPERILGRVIEPIYAYPHTSVAAATLGGFVYRGERFPELHGWYVFADNNDGTVMAFDPGVGTPYDRRVQVLTRAGQFGQMGLTGVFPIGDGRIFLTSLGSKQRPDGEILELVRASGAAPAPPPERQISSVDELYESLCSRCHGLDGRGQPELDATPAMKARPDFTSSAWQSSVSDDHIRKTVTGGGRATGRSEEMPAFGALLSAERLEELVRKLRAFGAEASAP